MTKRLFIPLSQVAHCTGSCLAGRAPCDCATGCTELANDIPHDSERVIQPPIETPEDRAYLARCRRWTLVAIAAAFSVLGALLGISNVRWTP